jgi:hypothetical protein
MNMIHRKIFGNGAMIAALGVISGSAAAATGDAQYISQGAVSACVKATANGAPTYPWDGTYNSSATETLTLDCSLPNSTEDSSGNSGITFLYVLAYDGSSVADISCSMQVVQATGLVQFTSASGSSSGVGDTLFNFNVPAGIYGAGYAGCIIPKADSGSMSGIHTVVSGGVIGP